MRIVNLPRFVISMSIIFITLFMIINSIYTKAYSYVEPKYETIIVASGDTLWDLAKNLDGDINENIYNIKKLNNLSSSEIYIGQELLIEAR